jgi:hypothetical protein
VGTESHGSYGLRYSIQEERRSRGEWGLSV